MLKKFEGYDVKNYCADGGTAEGLNKLIEALPEWHPPEEQKAAIVSFPTNKVTTDLPMVEKNSSADTLETALRKLVAMAEKADSIGRQALRAKAIQEFKAAGIPGATQMIDVAMATAVTKSEPDNGRLSIEDVEPWPEEVDGRILFNDLRQTLKRYLVLPPFADFAIVLFILFTYVAHNLSIDTAAILAIQSPVKRSGKTRVLEILFGLVCRALLASNVSSAALFRAIDKYRATVIIDEFDASQKDNEELRNVLNSGWRRSGAKVIRCTGDDQEPKIFDTFGPKIISGCKSLRIAFEFAEAYLRGPLARRMKGEIVDQPGRKEQSQSFQRLIIVGGNVNSDIKGPGIEMFLREEESQLHLIGQGDEMNFHLTAVGVGAANVGKQLCAR